MSADYIILGNMNVGKSTLFRRLSRANGRTINIPGTTLSVTGGDIRGQKGYVWDTPGIHSIFAAN